MNTDTNKLARELRAEHCRHQVPGADPGIEIGATQHGPAPAGAGVPDDDLIERRLTAAMREADSTFQRVGGSTRHHVRDCLLPVLEKHGLVISPTAAHQPVGQEPVGWAYRCNPDEWSGRNELPPVASLGERDDSNPYWIPDYPLYAAPPAQAVPRDLLRWVQAQADDPNANERFRELATTLSARD